MNINELNMNIKDVPQGYTLASAFSTDMHWVGLPGFLNHLFYITERDDKEHEVGSVAKIDNLYMLFVKESSYDAPQWSALKDCLIKLANKVDKKLIKHLAMPRICSGKNGFLWDDVKQMIEEIFYDIDVDILICYQ